MSLNYPSQGTNLSQSVSVDFLQMSGVAQPPLVRIAPNSGRSMAVATFPKAAVHRADVRVGPLCAQLPTLRRRRGVLRSGHFTVVLINPN